MCLFRVSSVLRAAVPPLALPHHAACTCWRSVRACSPLGLLTQRTAHAQHGSTLPRMPRPPPSSSALAGRPTILLLDRGCAQLRIDARHRAPLSVRAREPLCVPTSMHARGRCAPAAGELLGGQHGAQRTQHAAHAFPPRAPGRDLRRSCVHSRPPGPLGGGAAPAREAPGHTGSTPPPLSDLAMLSRLRSGSARAACSHAPGQPCGHTVEVAAARSVSCPPGSPGRHACPAPPAVKAPFGACMRSRCIRQPCKLRGRSAGDSPCSQRAAGLQQTRVVAPAPGVDSATRDSECHYSVAVSTFTVTVSASDQLLRQQP